MVVLTAHHGLNDLMQAGQRVISRDLDSVPDRRTNFRHRQRNCRISLIGP